MKNIYCKGQTIIDLPLALFFILVGFLIFFALVNYTSSDYSTLNKYLVITENAISKYNPSGIGYALVDKGTKITYQNTIDDIDHLEDPLKEVQIYNENNEVIKDVGKATCSKKIIIPRLVIYGKKISIPIPGTNIKKEMYDGSISKANFIFCK